MLDATERASAFSVLEIGMKVSPQHGWPVSPYGAQPQGPATAPRRRSNETAYWQRWPQLRGNGAGPSPHRAGLVELLPLWNCGTVFSRLQRWVQNRFRLWLWKKYDKTLGRYRSSPRIACTDSISSGRCPPPWRGSDSHCGERPRRADAGKLPVRFDEGRRLRSFYSTI